MNDGWSSWSDAPPPGDYPVEVTCADWQKTKEPIIIIRPPYITQLCNVDDLCWRPLYRNNVVIFNA